jgi:glucose dehydrogenase
MPGWIGGAGWGSVAVDPVRGVLLVKATNSPTLARLFATEDDRGFILDPELPGGALTLTLPEPWWWVPGWRRDWRIPVTRPPYGTLTAFDLASGEIVWQVPAGRNRSLERHPAIRAAGLTDLGTIGSPGGITTASGLTFLSGGGTELIAYATESGRVVWSHPLEGQGFAVPATYSTSDGRQYVVVGVGTFGLQAFAIQ